MPRPLNEQVVVITGASSGIGREAALKFGRAGACVVLAARNAEALNEVAEEIRAAGGEALPLPTDVADWTQVQQLATRAIEVFGRIDTWVNDAAVSLYATVEETDVDEFQRLAQVNYMGTVHGVKAALPHMRRQGYGVIVNIGSVESDIALPLQAAYAATKHAVKGLTNSLRIEQEHEKTGVKITLIQPSGINTPFFNHARAKTGVKPMPLPPAYKPELVADAILYTAEHPQREMYIGGAGMSFRVLQRISPALLDRFLRFRGMAFRLQQTEEPAEDGDNLYRPSEGPGRVEGDFAQITKPSMYTRTFEFMPRLLRMALVPVLAFVAMGLRRRAVNHKSAQPLALPQGWRQSIHKLRERV